MDKSQAIALARRVKGKVCNGWAIGNYINCGKSAIVLHACKEGIDGAIKIFDPELVERFGAGVQQERINREISLVGKKHPNLVEILDGGIWTRGKKSLYYIVMEYLPWKNLAEALQNIPVGLERQIISQVASAAEFLETLGICHRDIKPENICISDDSKTAKLLDLGVVRIHGAKPLTDGTHGKVFIGTLKYSPPEYLLRKEKDTLEGWRAITFYQLGAVLHDLIMKRSLFEGLENPYARLVLAVQNDIPEIVSQSVSSALIDLANTCLLKDPSVRTKYIKWSSFAQEPSRDDSITNLRVKIAKRKEIKSAQESSGRSAHDYSQRLSEYSNLASSVARLECIKNRDTFPPIELHPPATKEFSEKVLRIEFEPSDIHSLDFYLQILIAIHWIDTDCDIVTISTTAAVSKIAFKKQIEDATPSFIYEGPYSEAAIKNHIRLSLYGALDLAQQIKNEDTEFELKQLDLKHVA